MQFEEVGVTRSAIVNCSFSLWYDKYRKHVPRARVIKPLPQSFVDYLTSDGIVLPEDGQFAAGVGTGDGEYSDWSDEEDRGPVRADPQRVFDAFSDTHEQIKQAIRELGPVTPKLNWSAPRDATWIMATNTMKCDSAADVYLLLNASNYIMHDVSRAFDDVKEDETDASKTTDTAYELVLRQWFNINPALEFRCFVKRRTLVGVSQRDLNLYDYLPELEPTIRRLVDHFFHSVLRDSFPDPDFVFDVYLPRPFNKVWLIDINPFSRKTDSLLFTWHELATCDSSMERYELRLITETNKSRFATKEHSENQVPQDLVDAGADTAKMVELAREWQAVQQKGEASNASEAKSSETSDASDA